MGEGGFGYDPVFVPEGYHVSFGILSGEEKNRISHRTRAFERLCRTLEGR
jgi:XTP/dITP diphosphohydrolase